MARTSTPRGLGRFSLRAASVSLTKAVGACVETTGDWVRSNSLPRYTDPLMFTGLIEETGSVVDFVDHGSSWRFRIGAQLILSSLAVGDSVAVNGCCLTVVSVEHGVISFDVLAETRRLTNFAALKVGDRVNLERSLVFGGKLGGHFVTGHVDGTGTIRVFERRGADTYLSVSVPRGMGRYVIHKGSIAIDGISLTVAEVGVDTVAVWLIPHTLAVTNLGGRSVGQEVNLEFDLLGKYVEKLLDGRMATQ